MGIFSHYAFQEALYAALSADNTLKQSVKGIFDFVPPKTEFPYITLGICRATDESTRLTRFTQLTGSMFAYSQIPGREETSRILADIHNALLDTTIIAAALVEAGYHLVNMRYTGSEIILLNNGKYRGSYQFTAFIQHIH